MSNKGKFFTETDFNGMISFIERLEPFRVRAFIEYQMNLSIESPFNWLQGLRDRMLKRGHTKPEGMSPILDDDDGLFGSHSGGTSNSSQINAAFMVVEGNLRKQVKLVNEGTNKNSINKGAIRITNAAKSLFCYLVQIVEIIARRPDESQESYCKMVCAKYDLDYSDKVRQEMSNVKNHFVKKNVDIIENQILTLIPSEDSEKIILVINNRKDSTDQNLYG